MNYFQAVKRHRMSPWRYVRWRIARRRTDEARRRFEQAPIPSNRHLWTTACYEEALLQYKRVIKKLGNR